MFVQVSVSTLVLIGFCDANVALKKPAFASSIFFDWNRFDADHGVDGNSNMDAKYNGCFMTHEPDYDPWWMVDLLATYLIESIRITDRHDGKRGHFRNFNIDVYTANPLLCPKAIPKRCTQFRGIFPSVRTLMCNEGVIGRYIKLYMFDTRPYHVILFCEFEVEATLITQEPSSKSYKRLPGVRFNESSSTYVLAGTLPFCAKTCAEDEACVGFNYRRSLTTCYMLPAGAEWTDLDDSNSDYNTYYLC